MAAWEFSLGVWLVVKGFRPSPITAAMDAATARVAELGGERLIDPIELPFGRFAPYKDSIGATFSLFVATPGS